MLYPKSYVVAIKPSMESQSH